MKNLNAIELSQKLIRIASYSGYNQQIINFLSSYLSNLGFKCDELIYDGDDSYKVNNLHAILNPNQSKKIIYFAGHTDIVNEGDINSWSHNPFAAEIVDDKLFGRGASDMKCALACFVIGVQEFLIKNKSPDFGIGFILTNDEEADGINGTKKVLKWMKEKNYNITSCIIGEPTNPNKLGEMLKIGRRGSVSFNLKIIGKQGHVAYPDIALNPNTIMINILRILKDHKFDNGNNFFDPTNLEVTSIKSQNLGGNVIPNEIEANFNVRFNDIHSGQDIIDLVKYVCDKSMIQSNDICAKYELDYKISGESFFCNPQKIAKLAQNSIKKYTDSIAQFSTTGGTSDARFIKDYCQDFVELGLVNKTAHKIDEYALLCEINQLKNIYLGILENYC